MILRAQAVPHEPYTHMIRLGTKHRHVANISGLTVATKVLVKSSEGGTLTMEQMHHIDITITNGAETDANNLIIILPFL